MAKAIDMVQKIMKEILTLYLYHSTLLFLQVKINNCKTKGRLSKAEKFMECNLDKASSFKQKFLFIIAGSSLSKQIIRQKSSFSKMSILNFQHKNYSKLAILCLLFKNIHEKRFNLEGYKIHVPWD